MRKICSTAGIFLLSFASYLLVDAGFEFGKWERVAPDLWAKSARENSYGMTRFVFRVNPENKYVTAVMRCPGSSRTATFTWTHGLEVNNGFGRLAYAEGVDCQNKERGIIIELTTLDAVDIFLLESFIHYFT